MLPGMEIFPRIWGIHASDGEFQFGFGGILALELKFQKKLIYGNGEFLRVFRILEQPTWQHWVVHQCTSSPSGSAGGWYNWHTSSQFWPMIKRTSFCLSALCLFSNRIASACKCMVEMKAGEEKPDFLWLLHQTF